MFLLRHVPLLRVLFRWTVRLLLPRKLVKARLAYLHAAREQLATPLHPSVVETLEWLFPERKRLAERAPRLLTPAISTPPAPSGRRGIERSTNSGWTIPGTRSGWPARRSWRTPSTASTDGSSASSCLGSTCISPPWLTSPDTDSRGRPGGRPRKSRLSPPSASEKIPPVQRGYRRHPRQHRRTHSLAASSTIRSRPQHNERRSLPPHCAAQVPRPGQETWRERPRCARSQWPRACPEGSLTPWRSVSRVGRLSVCGRSRNRRESGPHVRAERNADFPDNSITRAAIPGPERHSFRTRWT